MTKIKYWVLLIWGGLLGEYVFGQNGGYYEEIPFELVRNKIIIRACVEGIEGRYIFDTGAPVCMTYSRLKKGAAKDFSIKKITDAHGQEMSYREVIARSVTLGSISFREVPVLVLEEGNPLECYEVDGIIGSALFPFSVVRLDTRRKVLTVASGREHFELNPRHVLPLQTNRQNIPYVLLNLGNGQEEKVMFDTGSPEFYEMNEPTYQALKSLPVMETLSRGYGALGMGVGGMEKAAVKYRVRLPEVRLGLGKFRNVITETMNGPGSRVGAGLLKYGVVILDFPGQKFYFDPYATPVDLYQKNWNVAVTVCGDSLIAGCVWESMQGELRGGEKVVAINGKRLEKIDPCRALTSSIVKMEGEEAVITILDKNGQEREIVIHKE